MFVSGVASAAAPRSVVLAVPCPDGGCEPELAQPGVPLAKSRRTVFLNFDGVVLTASKSEDDARTDTSLILAISGAAPSGARVVIEPLDVDDLREVDGLDRDQVIRYVVSELERIHAPYDIAFVTARPSAGAYSMVVFGGTCGGVANMNCAGVALLDCNDRNQNNISFAFPVGLRVGDLVTTAAQEMAHAFGLTHTTDSQDVMFPRIQPGFRPERYGAGEIPAGDLSCAGELFQNSHQRMLDIVGASGQDLSPPVVEILEPSDGSLIEGTVVVRAQVADASAIVRAELVIDGGVVAIDETSPYEFAFAAELPPGAHQLAVRARDGGGNMGSDQITVLVGECRSDADCAEGLGCLRNSCVDMPDPGPKALGRLCVADEECASLWCLNLDGESRCSQSCADNTDCPSAFECRDASVCWLAEGAAAGPTPGADDTTRPAACEASVAAGAGGGGVAAIVVLGLALLLLVRRPPAVGFVRHRLDRRRRRLRRLRALR